MECYVVTMTESKLAGSCDPLKGLNHVADEHLPKPTIGGEDN